jgi:hypothetical protein
MRATGLGVVSILKDFGVGTMLSGGEKMAVIATVGAVVSWGEHLVVANKTTVRRQISQVI